MNLKRGFRRITLLLSIIIALIVWFWFSESRFTNLQKYQAELKQDADQYNRFWNCWDADDFCFSFSKRMIIEDLMSGPEEFKMVAVPKGNDIEVLILDPNLVFPEINQLREYWDTSYDMLIINDSDLEEAAQTAKAKCIALEPLFSMYFVKSKGEMFKISILKGIPFGIGAFLFVWLFFLIFKWISRGFHNDGANADKTSSEVHVPLVVPEVTDEFDSEMSTKELVKNKS